MALSRENRLTQKKDFDIIFKEGSTIKGNSLFIKYKQNHLSNPRFAFIVPIKVTHNVVIRNRVKRQLSESIRQNINKIGSSYDIVVTVKKKDKEDVLKLELLNLLNKANILK